jgi:hypothetical protein
MNSAELHIKKIPLLFLKQRNFEIQILNKIILLLDRREQF